MVALKRAVCFVSPKYLERLLGFFGFLRQKNGLNVWQDTTLGNSDASQQFVQFFVIPDCELQMPWNDSCFLVVPGRVTGELQHFSRQVFENGGQVDRGTGTDSLGVVTFSKESMDSTDWKLKPGSTGSGLRFSFNFACFTFA